MRRMLLLLWMIAIALPAQAADPIPAGSPSGPNADNAPLQAFAGKPEAALHSAPPPPSNCPQRPPLAEGAPSSVIVQLDPDTLWRPRGAEVRFTISSPGGPVGVAKVRVCFGWSSADGAFKKNEALIGSPQVRSISNDTGVVEYGAVVPFLRSIPSGDWWPKRVYSNNPYIFTGAYSVPVADMIVEVTTTSGQVVVSGTQVGVTNVIVACVVALIAAVLVWLAVDGIARFRGVRGRNLLLRTIATQDGYASLSQLQIVLWTAVVGLSAIYVMTLSGNLIDISDGTLVLLGIASGAALVARVPRAGPPPNRRGATPNPPPALAAPIMPEWSDLVVPNRATREIDVTRLQMLAFTLITAAFVAIKVIVDYEIPSIPTNFLVLMGISNGVYMGGRRLPSQPKNGGVAPGAEAATVPLP